MDDVKKELIHAEVNSELKESLFNEKFDCRVSLEMVEIVDIKKESHNEETNIELSTNICSENSCNEVVDNELKENLSNQESDFKIANAESKKNDCNQSNVTNDKPYECYICGKLFSRNSSLKCHIRLHIDGPENMLQCGNGKSFNIESISIPVSYVKEEIASKINNAEIERTDDQNTHHCVFCEQFFSTKQDLKNHIQLHITALQNEKTNNDHTSISNKEMEDDNVNCFVENIQEQKMLRSFALEKEYACVICNKTFSRKSSLIMHYKFHPYYRSSQVENEDAEKSTSSKNLCEHLEKIDNVNSKSFIVEVVDRNNLSPTMKQVDIENQIDETNCETESSKQYKCYICNKEFARNSSLMWHIQFHETYMRQGSKRISQINESLQNVSNETKQNIVDHTCNICGKVFETISRFKKHMSFHGVYNNSTMEVNHEFNECGIGERTCPVCGKDFSTISSMKRHLGSIHKDQIELDEDEALQNDVDVNSNNDDESCGTVTENGEYKCSDCSRTFTQYIGLKRHFTWIHKTRDHDLTASFRDDSCQRKNKACKCDKCGRIYSTRSNMLKHALYHCKGAEESLNEYQCDMCDKYFDTESELEVHTTRVHGEDHGNDSSKCHECGRKFSDSRARKIHFSHAHRPKINCTDEDSLINTEESMQDEDTFECTVCNKLFGSVRGMKIHFKSAHKYKMDHEMQNDDIVEDKNSDEEESFNCEVCGETFLHFRSFKVHTGWHVRRGEDVVDTFKMKDETFDSNLKNSNEVGSDKSIDETGKNCQQFECPVCNQTFSSIKAKAGHMKIHSNRNVINHVPSLRSSVKRATTIKSINSKSELSFAAVKTSTTVKQNYNDDSLIDCNLCGLSFITKQRLSKHVQDHSAENIVKENVDLDSYKCKFCYRSFEDEYSLNIHYLFHQTQLSRLTDLNDTNNELQIPNGDVGEHINNIKRSIPSNHVNGESSPVKRRFCNIACTSSSISDGKDSIKKPYQCRFCERSFLLPCHLQKHTNSHPEEKKTKSIELVDASLSLTQVEEMPFECVYCEMCFIDKDVLLKHVRSHEEQDIRYFNKDNLSVMSESDFDTGDYFVIQNMDGKEEFFAFEEHENTNDGYECNECEESYCDKLQMVIHISHHMSKRNTNGHTKPLIIKAKSTILAPYKCLFCDERFINKKYRSNHMLKCHTENIFQCDSCKKLFLLKSKLQLHCRLHMIDTKYSCRFCHKYFTSKWFLKRHIRKQCTNKISKTVNDHPNADVKI